MGYVVLEYSIPNSRCQKHIAQRKQKITTTKDLLNYNQYKCMLDIIFERIVIIAKFLHIFSLFYEFDSFNPQANYASLSKLWFFIKNKLKKSSFMFL